MREHGIRDGVVGDIVAKAAVSVWSTNGSVMLTGGGCCRGGWWRTSSCPFRRGGPLCTVLGMADVCAECICVCDRASSLRKSSGRRGAKRAMAENMAIWVRRASKSYEGADLRLPSQGPTGPLIATRRHCCGATLTWQLERPCAPPFTAFANAVSQSFLEDHVRSARLLNV